MKKLLAVLITFVLLLSFASLASAKAVDIDGNESFFIWNQCNNRERDESLIIFAYNSCTSSVDMYPVVEAYAKEKGVTMYAVDGSLLGVREALGGGSVELPAVVVYNKATKTIGGADAITSKAVLKEVADKILDERNPEIKITIDSDIMLCDGKEIKLDVPATIINGRTMLPLRAILEAIGAKVTWNESSRYIQAEKGVVSIGLGVGSTSMSKTTNYFIESIELDSPAVIVDGRTLVPARAVTEPFGCEVSWDEITRTVTIK